MQGPRAGEAGREDADCVRAAAALARGDLQAAAQGYAEAIRRGVKDTDAFNNLGVIVAQTGDLDTAIALFEAALGLTPERADPRQNLARALAVRGVERFHRGQFPAAAADLKASLARVPEAARTIVDLAAVYLATGQLAEAALYCRQALVVDADFAPAHANLAAALLQQGELEGALTHTRRAMELAPGRADYHSALLMALNYDARTTPRAVAEEHRRYSSLFTPPAARARPGRKRARRLRVGYLSPDLRRHSVAYFFEPLLRVHDRRAVEITCYSDWGAPDEMSERLRGHSEHWRVVAGVTDQALAELVQRDEIDVLVDLAGHTNGNRLAMFAGRVAPVQLTYLGYPATTGLTAMDLRVTDAVADPVGTAEALHTERLVRLEGGFLAYAPPLAAAEDPGVAPLPAGAAGGITFGSFNALSKINDQVLDAWATLLQQVPGSRLLLKARALADETVRQRLWTRLEGRRIDRSRVELAPPVAGSAGHLASYARVDIALDTFPYNGTTTTFEALWMGVPVVTFAGAAHAGRVGASILTHLGLPELAPATLEESLQAATDLAADRDRLAALRRSMRERLQSSPLMDAARVARQLEAAYHQGV
jgi:protein O-GlcNAc transferase